MRYLGIDYGTRTIGLALSDAKGMFAFPLEVVPNDSHALENIAHVIEEKKVEAIVVGDTRADTGVANNLTAQCEKFSAQLGSRTKLSVSFGREAWSSFEAARYAPDEKKRDEVAAAIILQRFLDAQPKKI
jgi:putative holliday junction resolvase